MSDLCFITIILIMIIYITSSIWFIGYLAGFVIIISLHTSFLCMPDLNHQAAAPTGPVSSDR